MPIDEQESLLSDHARRVRDFMVLGGQEIPLVPSVPDREVIQLRLRLLWEELLEITEAYGMRAAVFAHAYVGSGVADRYVIPIDAPAPSGVAPISADLAHSKKRASVFFFSDDAHAIDLAKIADGHADLSVVNVGSLLACGIPDIPLLEEVDRANLSKFADGWYKDEFGKIIKSPLWSPPDISEVLRQARVVMGGRDEI